MIAPFPLLCFSFLLWPSVASGKQVRGLQDSVTKNGQPNNPGMVVRVTKKGLVYLEGLAGKVMRDRVQSMQVADTHVSTHDGYLNLKNMHVTQFNPPATHAITMEEPDTLRWTISDAGLSLEGDFDGVKRVLLTNTPISGRFKADATGVDLSISLLLSKSADGGLAVKSRGCTAAVKQLTADVKVRPTSLGAGLASLFKNSVLDEIRPAIADELCRQGRQFVDEKMNEQLSSLAKKVPLNQTSYGLRNAQRDARIVSSDNEQEDYDKKAKTKEDLRSITNSLVKRLVLDISMIRNPLVTANYIESYGKGEISYEGQGGTPFYPAPLAEPRPLPTNRMLHIVASDYVLNSCFWHAYKHGLLTFIFNGQKYPEQKLILRTSCDEDVFALCLGNIVPEVGKTFPHSDVEIVFQQVKSPAVYFRKDGKVKLTAPSYVTAYAVKNGDRKEMMTADLYIESEMKMWLDKLYLKSNGTITKFNMTLRNNNIKNFNQQKLDEFSNAARAMVQESLNNDLMKGLPLPTIQGAKLVRPVLRIYERTVRIEADATVDENVLASLAENAMRREKETSER